MDELSPVYDAIAARYSKAEVSSASNGTVEQSSNRLMTTEFRPKLLTMSAKLDQLLSQADELIAEPVYVDIGELADELRELLVDMQARVEQHLDDRFRGGI
jgi:hypothetical protein